jgi:hypothetical protein
MERDTMQTRTWKEWKRLYDTLWRAPFAHFPREVRARLVRGCAGKAVYESSDEALAVVARLPVRPGELLGSYDCPLCGGIHTGNRKYLRWDSARTFAQIGRRCNGTVSGSLRSAGAA